jgi:hypothetical protein
VSILELIERQITYADFAVDPAAIELLRFKRAVFTVYTGGEPINHHPAAEWGYQKEHVFYHCLTRAARALIVKDGEGERVLDFEDFNSIAEDPERRGPLHPFPRLLEKFSPADKPIFWSRLVCFGYLCNDYLSRAGAQIGFEDRPFEISQLLQATKDGYILARLDQYEKSFRSLAKRGL